MSCLIVSVLRQTLFFTTRAKIGVDSRIKPCIIVSESLSNESSSTLIVFDVLHHDYSNDSDLPVAGEGSSSSAPPQRFK